MRVASHPWQINFLACVAVVLLPLLAGCATPQPTEQAQVIEAAPPFTSTGNAGLQERWWRSFGDEGLNDQVRRGTQDNFALRAAWQRLRAAQAAARVAAADLYPTLDATAGAQAQEGSSVSDNTDLSLGLEAAYELDLWDRIASQAQAERFRAQADRFDYQATALLLSGQITRAWYRLINARAQLDLIEQQVQTNEQVLDLLTARFDVGQIRSADVLRQKQLIEATREQAILARQDKALLTHQLLVLTGQSPQSGEIETKASLPELPPAPATGLPGELVQRRPDVREAYALLQAADRELASAVSNQYPRITLFASLTSSASNAKDLFNNWLGSVAGQAVAPLLDGGQRRAEVDRTAAVRDQRIAEYGNAVLIAFQEVQDALALERTRSERLRNIETRIQTLRQTYEQLRTQYINGVTDYLAVLDVLTEQQSLERTRLNARLDQIEARISLHSALAGGFDTPRDLNDASVAMEKQPDE